MRSTTCSGAPCSETTRTAVQLRSILYGGRRNCGRHFASRLLCPVSARSGGGGQGNESGDLPLKSDRRRLIRASLLVSFGVIGAIVLLVTLVPERYTSHIPNKWTRLSILTCFIFWYLWASYRKLHASFQFWTIYVIMFLFHLFAVGHLFRIYPGGISMVTFAVVGVADFVFMGLIIRWFLGVWPNEVSLRIGNREGSKRRPLNFMREPCSVFVLCL